jgi:glycine/D-amino acid oxidase-like deaminating enzyme
MYPGGGIIGCTTAYYLTRHPRFDPSLHTVTLVEAARIANGASGKAGGLLASWAYPSNLAGLSFDLHDQLAKEHNGAELWGYRRVRCGQLTAVGNQPIDNRKLESRSHSTIELGKWWSGDRKNASVLPDDLDWFNDESAQAYEEFADTSSTAQVHPLQFTNSIAKLAEQGGARFIIGKVEHINCGDVDCTSGNTSPLTSFEDLTQKKVVSVTYVDKATSEKHTLPTTTVVLAAGPWTPTLLPKVRMSPLRAHSVTIKLKRPVSAYCLFTNITLDDSSQPSTYPDLTKSPSAKTISPEIYARPNNELYICSQGDFDVPLPSPTDVVAVSSHSCQEIIGAAASVSDELRNGQVTGRRACYLPTIDVGVSSGPLVGLTELEGLLLATGHSGWGILNAPATGKVISELIFDGEVSCAEVANLDPRISHKGAVA